jgi:hypothetical protein
MDNKSKFLIALPSALVILMLFAAYYVPFDADLSRASQQILAFVHSDIGIEERKGSKYIRNLKSPIEFPQSIKTDVDADSGDDQSKENQEDQVSLIVISNGNKMAMIDGMPLKEGDSYDDKRVVKIEPDRVLLKNKTSRWVYIGK